MCASIIPDAVREGDSVTFTVSLEDENGQLTSTSEIVTVEYATRDRTAEAGLDYEQQSGTLTFDPDESQKTITVQTSTDDIWEPEETFRVDLSQPDNADPRQGRRDRQDQTRLRQHQRRRPRQPASGDYRSRRARPGILAAGRQLVDAQQAAVRRVLVHHSCGGRNNGEPSHRRRLPGIHDAVLEGLGGPGASCLGFRGARVSPRTTPSRAGTSAPWTTRSTRTTSISTLR